MQRGKELSAEDKYLLLREISFKVKDTFDLDIILNLLLDTLYSVLKYDAAGIFILSEIITDLHYKFPGQKISGIARRGYKRVGEADEMLIQGKGIIGHVIGTGESLIVDDVRLEPRYVVGRQKTVSEITVPIFINDKVIGALDVESDQLAAFNKIDLELLRFFSDASAISIERAILHQQILVKEKLQEQMQIAKDVQSSLLPSQPPDIEGYEIASICIPTFEIGGDYYDYIKLDENNLAIIIADVSGDGIPAALLMASFRAILRNQLKVDPNPSEVMNVLNKQVSEIVRKRDFITAFYAKLNYEQHKISFTNCGHNPPILLKSNGKIELLETGDPALNILDTACFNSNSVSIAPGDEIVFYTDGVVEIFNKDSEEYNVERLQKVILDSQKKSASEIITNIVESTKSFSAAELYRDDFTIVVLKRK